MPVGSTYPGWVSVPPVAIPVAVPVTVPVTLSIPVSPESPLPLPCSGKQMPVKSCLCTKLPDFGKWDFSILLKSKCAAPLSCNSRKITPTTAAIVYRALVKLD